MGDDDDGLSVVSHVADYRKKFFRFLRSKHGSRLIEYEYVGAAVQNLDYFKRLLLGNGHFIDLFVRVKLKAVFTAYLCDPCGDSPEVEFAVLFKTENDVFRRRKNIYQLEMLIDHANAESKGVLGRTYGDRFTLYINLTLVGIIDARQHIHKRCLAAAVFAEQCEYFAFAYLKRGVVICDSRAEALGYITHFDCELVL